MPGKDQVKQLKGKAGMAGNLSFGCTVVQAGLMHDPSPLPPVAAAF